MDKMHIHNIITDLNDALEGPEVMQPCPKLLGK